MASCALPLTWPSRSSRQAHNAQRDRETTLKLSSQQGVREYWIVDRERQAIQVYRRTEAALLELAATYTPGDLLS